MTAIAPIPAVADLAARVCAGERLAIARAMTELERLSPAAGPLLESLGPHLGAALVVGITGPPGAGKSTLVNALIAQLRQRGARVGVIAVDPSSPVSGGAILGDRIRMTAALDDDGVFVRSLASRGATGGLSPAAVRMIDVLDAAGFRHILLETVGAGQSEIDIATIADVRVVVSAPGLGDGIQAMKSGLLEIADILVVNKGDREGAEQTLQQLIGAVALRSNGGGSDGGRNGEAGPGDGRGVPVLKTTAVSGEGVDRLIAAIGTAGTAALATPARERRRRRAHYLIARAAADLIAARIRDGADADLERLSDAVLAGALAPADAARRLLAG